MIRFSSDPIELDVTNGVAVTIKHGLGRQVAGWLVIYQTVVVSFVVQDPDADTRKELVLVPNASGFVRLVLL